MSSLTLLCASDPSYEEDLVHYLRSQQEFTVVTTRTGSKTLDRLEDDDIDILLFGRDLPDMSADDLLRHARRRNALLPAISLTDGRAATADDGHHRPTATVQMQRPDAVERVCETIREVVQYLRRGELHPLEEHHRGVLDRITDSFYLLDDEWRFSYVNRSAENLLQRSAEQLIGRSIWDVFPEAANTHLHEAFVRARDSGERAEFELYYEPLETWFHVIAYPSRNGLSVYFRDITDRMLQTWAMDAAELGILITDPHQSDNPIIYANEGFRTLTGYAETEIRGRNTRFLQGPRTDPEPVSQMRAAIDAREAVTVELINYRKNGTPFWNRVHITPVFDPNGNLTHFIGFQQDVTARVEEERRAELLHRVLRHNIRNSMNVILGQISTLEETTPLDGVQLAPITEHGEDLLRLAERARDIDAVLEREQFEPRAIPLAELSTAAVGPVRREYPGATIEIGVPDDIRVIGSDALVVAFEELLENGIKHATRTHPTVTVTTDTGTRRFRPEGPERPVVNISFVDSAPPLTDQERAALTGEDETPLRHGSGLGLWLVQWIVTMSGGSITATERPSGGNEITVTLFQSIDAP